MDGSLSTAEAVYRFVKKAETIERGSLRALVLGLCASAGDCTRYAMRGDLMRLQWALLEVLWCACGIAKGDAAYAAACSLAVIHTIPCGSLDSVVLRLFRVVSQVAEVYRWFDSTGNNPLGWDELPEVVALAVLALDLTGVDVPQFLTGETKRATPD